MASKRTNIRIGISGWRYTPWRGFFYPEDFPQRLELHYASRVLPTIEINGSFYSLQYPESYRRWCEDTPADFAFAVKGPRFITRMKKLKDVEAPLANFFASGVFNLERKLGPILWQFPPNFGYDPARLTKFFALLPRDTAVETARRFPMMHDITADFVYMRLHGDKELYRSGYSDRALDCWARRIAAWHRGSEPRDADKILKRKPPTAKPRDVYCYFDNTDVKLRAPVDAQTLIGKLNS